MYFTYVLQSLKDRRYYYGSASNLEERLKAHNAGKVRSTKSRRPQKIVFYETFGNSSKVYEGWLY
ncbi:MAG: GIY-YIG nuclease family protein [Melioribacter sp.]|uniref:GIY-YIG nuclease family protein n=1 Tax=Melioribacter sp. TaxID=2052167 RepID=UPI003BD5DF89